MSRFFIGPQEQRTALVLELEAKLCAAVKEGVPCLLTPEETLCLLITQVQSASSWVIAEQSGIEAAFKAAVNAVARQRLEQILPNYRELMARS